MTENNLVRKEHVLLYNYNGLIYVQKWEILSQIIKFLSDTSDMVFDLMSVCNF